MAESEVIKLEEFLRNAFHGRESVIEVAKEMLDGKEAAIVKLSRPPVEPVRAESMARNHTFHQIEAFIDYLEKYGGSNTVALAEVRSQRVRAVLDEAAPEGFETVAFIPQIHPLLEPWMGVMKNTSVMSAKGAATLILQNKRTIVEDVQSLLLVFNQIKISKKVEIQTGSGVRSINGMMVETQIQGQVKNEIIELPEFITIEAPLFVGTPSVKIEIDLAVQEVNNQAMVGFSSSDLNVKILEAFCQSRLRQYSREHQDRAIGSTAELTIKVTMKREKAMDTFSIKALSKKTLPGLPPSVTMAMGGESQDDKDCLFIRRSGSTADSPRQGVLTTQDGRTVNTETGEVIP